MDTVFLNAIDKLGLSITEAVAATSTLAAHRIGLSNCGEIAVGYKADLLSYNADDNSITLIN
jgi:N-acetylglucosamine-6-phosphate deacetylase